MTRDETIYLISVMSVAYLGVFLFYWLLAFVGFLIFCLICSWLTNMQFDYGKLLLVTSLISAGITFLLYLYTKEMAKDFTKEKIKTLR